MENTSKLLIYEQGIPGTEEIVLFLGWKSESPFVTILTDEKSIKIEHIRDLQSELNTVSSEPRLVLILPGERITLPAQQALLKLLEEPPENTSIVIPVQSRQSLLPTIQSRCVAILVGTRGGAGETQRSTALWDAWQAAPTLADKVRLTQQFSGKREDLQPLLESTLQALSRGNSPSQQVHFRLRLLESLEALKGNVSPQLCLEHLLLV